MHRTMPSRRIADMEAKKSVLALKQEMVEAAFEAAKAYIAELPREQYTEFLARMASEASENGTEELVLNASDKAELGKAVCKRANEKLAAAGKLGKLTLSEDTAGEHFRRFLEARRVYHALCAVAGEHFCLPRAQHRRKIQIFFSDALFI